MGIFRFEVAGDRRNTTSILSRAVPSKLDLSWIAPHLAVGARIPWGSERSLSQRGIRAVVDLRAEEQDDEEALRGEGIALLCLPVDDGMGCSQATLQRGVAWVEPWLERGDSVLIHCEHGIGRSALLACCVLARQGYEPLAALSLARARRPIISPSRAQLEAYLDWLGGFGCERWRDRPLPSLESLLKVAWGLPMEVPIDS